MILVLRTVTQQSPLPGLPTTPERLHYSEVTCRVTRETLVEQGFHRFRGWVFWLLQGEWDRRVDEFEGSALGGGWDGEQVEAGLVVAGDA